MTQYSKMLAMLNSDETISKKYKYFTNRLNKLNLANEISFLDDKDFSEKTSVLMTYLDDSTKSLNYLTQLCKLIEQLFIKAPPNFIHNPSIAFNDAKIQYIKLKLEFLTIEEKIKPRAKSLTNEGIISLQSQLEKVKKTFVNNYQDRSWQEKLEIPADFFTRMETAANKLNALKNTMVPKPNIRKPVAVSIKEWKPRGEVAPTIKVSSKAKNAFFRKVDYIEANGVTCTIISKADKSLSK